MDFSSIQKKHILKAIQLIDEKGVAKRAHSTTYDVVYKGLTYPPKYIVSLAYEIATGKKMPRNKFEGGKDTPCFNILEKCGFEIVLKGKEDFFSLIKKFVIQSETKSLKTKEYKINHQGLSTKASFGQGGQAKIPWISLLAEGQTTSNGIYPVYLLFKEYGILLLAYGISETKKPSSSWKLKDPETVGNFFKKQGKSVSRYGKSYVFRAYDVNNLSQKEINRDLDIIIKKYKEDIYDTSMNANKNNVFMVKDFITYIENTNLSFSESLISRYVSSLLAKPFVILSGLSGSGKTQLTLAFARWICEDFEKQCKLVAVGADWTNREPLLGYPNALENGKYCRPDHGVLDLIINANKNLHKPYFLILDEMNLSYVERYFADFLSSMESGEPIALHPDTGEWSNCDIPANISLPKNLFIVGTVNIDETTYMFSPKVLDRANTIEFRIQKKEMSGFLNGLSQIDMSKGNGNGASMAESFLKFALNKDFSIDNEVNKVLLDFFENLKKCGAEFGYRSATEIIRLINNLKLLNPKFTEDEKIDIAIVQKLLPKLHGSRRKLCPILKKLGTFCITDKIKDIEKDVFEKDDFNLDDKSLVKFPISLEKISRMYKGALENGFTSYAEA